MSDTELQSLIRNYNAAPNDSATAGRLISALLRIHNGEIGGTSEDVKAAPQAIAFFIECATGCTCCSNENHFTGPWRSLKRAQEAAQSYHDSKRLASQYASNGVYTISWMEAEILPDGRIIIEDRIFGGFDDDPDYDGWNEDIKSDDFYGGSTNLEQAKEGDPPVKGWKQPIPHWYIDPED